MSNKHFRSASAADRRSIHSNGPPARVNSINIRNYERPSVHESGSPILAEFEDVSKAKVSSEEAQLRREKRTIKTTETYQLRRSPVKEYSDVDNPSRRKILQDSPGRKRPQRDPRADSKPWRPEAKLVPCSSAPLAVRISAPPLQRDAPETLDAPPLLDMTMAQQEEVLLDDLLFVLMGFEGQYICYVDGYNPIEEKDKLLGPAWRVSHGLDPSLKDLIESMLTMASQYSALEAFVEVQSRKEYGSVNHALCAAIRRLLKDYLILIAQLESRITDNHEFTLHKMHLSIMPTAQSIAQLYTVAQELLKRNSLLEEDVEDSADDFDADNIIERLKEGGDLLPGSMLKKRCIGGNVLALLTQRLVTYSGDPSARQILEMLLREASKPYMTMLNEWLHHGGIKDPHDEFLIGERQSIKRERLDEDYTDEYWEKRYYIREKEIPPQLAPLKDKILLAGKYLNVVRECGGVNITSSISHIPLTFDDPRFLDNINHAYSFANRELLSLMLAKNSLRDRLRSIKHYFFLDRAEFFLYFLELASSELAKPSRSVNVGKLQSLLDLVLHQPGSIAVSDPYKDDVHVKLNDLGLVPWLMKIVNVQGLDTDDPAQMAEQYKITTSTAELAAEKDIHGHDALELDYSVPFPLSLIISRKTITRYQLILRYTLSLRQLEQTLLESWSEHNKAFSWLNKSHTRRIEIWKRRAWNLRARMLIFVQQMLFYATAEVLEPQFQKLMAKVGVLESSDLSSLSQTQTQTQPQRPSPSSSSNTANQPRPPSNNQFSEAQTVDNLIQSHLDMLDTSLKDLGLTQSKLLRIHAKMTAGCTMFASYTSNLTRNLYSADPSLSWVTQPPQTNQDLKAKIDRARRNFEQFSAAHGRKEVEIPPHDESRLAKIEDTLTKHEEYFNRHLRILRDTLEHFAATETVTLLGLCGRLSSAEVQKREDRV